MRGEKIEKKRIKKKRIKNEEEKNREKGGREGDRSEVWIVKIHMDVKMNNGWKEEEGGGEGRGGEGRGR